MKSRTDGGREGRMSLGETIRKAREGHQLTQSALAQRVGVTPGFITKLEKGEALPGSELVLALAGVLDLGSGELLHLAESARSERSGRRIRTRGAAIRQVLGVGGPRPPGSAQVSERNPLPRAEQLGRMILDDEELRSAFEHLRAAVADPDLKATVLKTLETFARQSGRSAQTPDRDRRKEAPKTDRS
jgi:transcriptional regulator with XRE-family HTH domain